MVVPYWCIRNTTLPYMCTINRSDLRRRRRSVFSFGIMWHTSNSHLPGVSHLLIWYSILFCRLARSHWLAACLLACFVCPFVCVRVCSSVLFFCGIWTYEMNDFSFSAWWNQSKTISPSKNKGPSLFIHIRAVYRYGVAWHHFSVKIAATVPNFLFLSLSLLPTED